MTSTGQLPLCVGNVCVCKVCVCLIPLLSAFLSVSVQIMPLAMLLIRFVEATGKYNLQRGIETYHAAKTLYSGFPKYV